MSRIVITGAGGFIGRDLLQAARTQGHEVVGLGRRAVPGAAYVTWQLGEPLPKQCHDADAVIHLACATLVERRSLSSAIALDMNGTQRLIESVRQIRQDGRRVRFVFLSSQSANAKAVNAYGRSKLAIEKLLDQDDEIVIRPGLVYDERFDSVFGLFKAILRFPVVPILTRNPNIQPIHLRELTESIVQVAESRRPDRCYCLGAVEPLTFEDTLRAVARRLGRRLPLMLPLPALPVRLITRLADRLLRITPPLTERIDGLIGLQPMETGLSLQALGRSLMPFDPA